MVLSGCTSRFSLELKLIIDHYNKEIEKATIRTRKRNTNDFTKRNEKQVPSVLIKVITKTLTCYIDWTC